MSKTDTLGCSASPAKPAISTGYCIGRFPEGDQVNPYLDLFYNALRPHGVRLEPDFVFEPSCLDRTAGRLNAVHLHWPEFFWQYYNPSMLRLPSGMRGAYRVSRITRRLRRRLGVSRFLHTLRVIQNRGLDLIWTLHNLEPHERCGAVDDAAYRSLAEQCDLVICHSDSTRRELLARHSIRGEVVVMALGNYDGAYPAPQDAQTTRAALGLDPAIPVVACLGGLRDYKGLDIACEAVGRLKGRIQLLVAGDPHDAFDQSPLEQAASAFPFIKIVPRTLSDQEFADYTAASDAILLPYRRITGSAALLSALTLGRSVIASDLPYFRETLEGHAPAGTLFQAENIEALATALEEHLKTPGSERERAARQLADRYRWDRVIEPVAAALEELKARRVPSAPREHAS